jgi:hypothetical protein
MNRRQLLQASTSASVLGLSACSQSVLRFLKEQDRAAIAATPLSKPLQRIAFGSCIDQNKPQPLWG